MCRSRSWVAVTLTILIATAGCAPPDEDPAERTLAMGLPGAGAGVDAERLERELEAARGRIVARADSVQDILTSVPGLSRRERADLRRDVNARQVATARSMGVRARSEDEVQRLIRQGRLVELKDSTEHWIVRELDYSVPYVTPDTRAMLQELGRRFHERLDSLGLPRYRMEVTSVLRTPATQAALRGRNANAARGVSAHEFATTVDVAHARFAAPAEPGLETRVPEETAPIRFVEALVLEEVARKHHTALQAELGRVLREMRDEGKVRVMMERRQAVYHMTVSRRFPREAEAE
jgi:hypothetical protein